jgi:hypothetical protein
VNKYIRKPMNGIVRTILRPVSDPGSSITKVLITRENSVKIIGNGLMSDNVDITNARKRQNHREGKPLYLLSLDSSHSDIFFSLLVSYNYTLIVS